MAQITELLDQNIVDTYVSMLESHAAHIRHNRAGIDEWKSVLPTSVIEPGTTWTSAEKNSFFHGLSIYSRLRPDLIAEAICHAGGQKSAADVGAYIAVLERASREKGRPNNWRAKMPVARVLTKRWRLFEEECADMLLMGEAAAERRSIEAHRKAQLEEADLGGASLSREVNAAVEHALKRKRRSDEDSDTGTLGSDTTAGHGFGSSHGREHGDNIVYLPSESGERAAKRRQLREQWMREDIFRSLDHSRVWALRGIYQHREQLQGDSFQGSWVSPIGKLALRLGYTPEALERDGITLIDWSALWKSTARLKFAFMDSRLQYRTPAGVTTLLPTEGNSYTMKKAGAIQYKTLQLLNAHVKVYVTSVIHRAVVLKERLVKDRPWEVLQRYEKELSGADMSKDRSGPDWLDQQCIIKAIELTGKPHTPAKDFRLQVGERLDLDLDVWPEEGFVAEEKWKAQTAPHADREPTAMKDVTGGVDETEALEEISGGDLDECATVADQPTTKKRGRPRKRPIDSNAALKPKRQRGRPRLPRDPVTGEKIRPPKTAKSGNADIEIEGVGIGHPSQLSPGPGIHPTAPPGTSANTETSVIPARDANANPPLKRGRGRPRKNRAEHQGREQLPRNAASRLADREDVTIGIIDETAPQSGASTGNNNLDIHHTTAGPYMSAKDKAKLREPPWAEARNIVILPLNRLRNPSRAARILANHEDGDSGDGRYDADSELDTQRDIDSDTESPGTEEEIDSEDELSEADRAEDVEYEKLLWEQFGMSYEEPTMPETERDFANDYGELGVRGSFVKSQPFIVSDDDDDDFVPKSASDDVYESS